MGIEALIRGDMRSARCRSCTPRSARSCPVTPPRDDLARARVRHGRRHDGLRRSRDLARGARVTCSSGSCGRGCFGSAAATPSARTSGRCAGWPGCPGGRRARRAAGAVRGGRPRRACSGCGSRMPVGLAAGMDKNGVALPAWPALGFGFVEVGTVTAHAQPGNDRPRLFRLPDSGAMINRMGFNNEGAEALAGRLAALGPLGGAAGHLARQVEGDAAGGGGGGLPGVVRRAAVRTATTSRSTSSSPNTPGLRSLQDRDHARRDARGRWRAGLAGRRRRPSRCW